jgi:enoyl-CoA hydratase
MDTARAVAASIVGNNRAAVKALLESYHRIDDAQTEESFRIELESAAAWIKGNASAADIAANRDAVISRGRSQIH